MHREELKQRVEAYDFQVKVALLVVSLATIALLGVAAYQDNFLPQWRKYQLQYKDLLVTLARNEKDQRFARNFPVELRQLVVPELGKADRCISCHLGIDDPRMAEQPNPFRSHPGDFLALHDVARFGCTTCHQGQGLATEVAAAHGHVPHWDHPMIEKRFLHSTCGRCHYEGDLFGGEGDHYSQAQEGSEILQAELVRAIPGGDLVTRGKELFRTNGCLGCHAYRGKGGTLGPDLTYVGDKTRHDFDFSRFGKSEHRTVESWLRKHFLEPEAVSPGTVMPPLELGADDATALTAYMLSLKRKSLPASHRPAPRDVATRPADGGELYRLMCAACHGRDGRASEVPGLRTPALNNPDFLAVASDDYLRFIISKGRSGTAMPSWSASLTQGEIDRLVAHVRGWESAGPDLRGVSSRRGDARHGKALYAGNCANCHGVEGKGGIGTTLNSATFLALASDDFLTRTIVHGRPGTAMPNWKDLREQDLSDLLAHIRSWNSGEHEADEVIRLSTNLEDAETIGALTYRAHCAVCHGAKGEGGIGVTLASNDFLARVKPRYIYEALTRGRPGTAMPSWNHLTEHQMAGVIAYLKSWQTTPDLPAAGPLPRGDWQLGEVAYRNACESCHGWRGQGGTGPQIANPVFLDSASDAQLFAWIGHGKAGTAMKGFLREAHGVVTLSQGQILDVIDYLRYMGMTSQPSFTPVATGDARRGAELYVHNCAACHGTQGEGASGPQLNNPVFLEAASDGFLAATIVLGRSGTAMRSMVHGREGLGQISPTDVDDVVAYLRRWQVDERWRLPRPAVEMTGEAIDDGRVAYRQFCSSCHGPSGKGVAEGEDYLAPALNNPEFLAAASDGYLLATIARGRRNTPMRPFGVGAGGIAELSGTTISNIVSFIRSWKSNPTPTITASATGHQVPMRQGVDTAGIQQGG